MHRIAFFNLLTSKNKTYNLFTGKIPIQKNQILICALRYLLSFHINGII